MTWANTTRTDRKARRRRKWHEDRIDHAGTEKRKLSAACDWLVSEAWQAGRVAEVLEYVLTKVHELREEKSHHDRDDNAA